MTDTKDTNVVHATQAEIDARMAEKIQKAPKREEGTLYSCLDFTDPVIVGNTFTSKMKLGKFHAQPFGWLNGELHWPMQRIYLDGYPIYYCRKVNTQ